MNNFRVQLKVSSFSPDEIQVVEVLYHLERGILEIWPHKEHIFWRRDPVRSSDEQMNRQIDFTPVVKWRGFAIIRLVKS